MKIGNCSLYVQIYLYAYSENTVKVFKHIWKIRRICVIGENANNTNFKFFEIPSLYLKWDGLSLKTISRYCSFKGTQD
jgi:hypothetical protein